MGLTEEISRHLNIIDCVLWLLVIRSWILEEQLMSDLEMQNLDFAVLTFGIFSLFPFPPVK